MQQGQAEIQANEGFRKYIKRAINIATRNAAMAADSELMGAVFKGRLITLKELLKKSEQAFKELSRIKELRKQ